MGLDITAYSKIKIVPDGLDSEGDLIDWDNNFRANINPDFKERAEGIEDGAVYSYDKSTGFRAGSYGGYNVWRNQLAELAGYEPIQGSSYSNGDLRHDEAVWASTEGTFYELIHFSDCEGVLGTEVCKKLLADFDAHAGKITGYDSYFVEKFEEWHESMRLAADDGCICFH